MRSFLGSSSWIVLAASLCPAFSWAAEASSQSSSQTSSQTVAQQVDQRLRQELPEVAGTPNAKLNDTGFLRRATLDLVGELPSPEQIAAFVLDPAKDKRTQLVERLLADPQFGENWGRYWRDVILYRRSDDRAQISGPAAEAFFAQQFNANTPWDKVATQVITAKGNVESAGETVLFMAQSGKPEETAAEVSRIFLGIQIQCAQCHDHPTDRWKREQFHQLAAFFPRAMIRPERINDKISFAVASFDTARPRMQSTLTAKASLEHYLPDLEDPTAKGKLLQPELFLTNQKLPTGSTDQTRRATLSTWLTAPSNAWFAKAFVNRMWGELVGQGFYEPFDDLGPDRQCSAPQTLDYLAAQFTAHHYDVKWLFRTIVATDAYQQAARRTTQASSSSDVPVAAQPQRLRGDQIFNCLLDALGVAEPPVPTGLNPRARLQTSRAQFLQVFGYDPSDPRAEVTGSIPQALQLMNGPNLAGQINGSNPRTVLGRLLTESKNDEDVAVELYLRCLAREPSDRELKTCLAYVKKVGNRREAFEDVLWSLLNSTEFVHRR